MDVTALGELLIDFTCIGVDAQGYPTMAAHPGGAPANFLAAVTACGGSGALLAKTGADAFGTLLRKTLDDRGVVTKGIIRDKGVFTTLAFVTLDDHGDRSFSFARKPGADTCLGWEEVDCSLIEASRVFHFGTLSLTHEPAKTATQMAVAYAKKLGKLLSFDPNLRLPLWQSESDARRQMLWGMHQADIVKLSCEEGAFLFGLEPEACARKLMEEFGVKLVYVTCGAEGCYYANRNSGGMVPALSGITVLDTTGAGDIFGGSALWAMLQTGTLPENLSREQLESIVTFANTAAALSTTKPGGISSIPTLSQIHQHLPKADFIQNRKIRDSLDGC